MRLLEKMEELNSNGKYPTKNELLQEEGIHVSIRQLELLELLQHEYLEEISVPDETSVGYNRLRLKISEKGKDALGRFHSQVRHFVSRLEELYGAGRNDDLYMTLEHNRELLWFAYYKRWITKSQIEKIAKKLQINVERIWWGDSQGETGG